MAPQRLKKSPSSPADDNGASSSEDAQNSEAAAQLILQMCHPSTHIREQTISHATNNRALRSSLRQKMMISALLNPEPLVSRTERPIPHIVISNVQPSPIPALEGNHPLEEIGNNDTPSTSYPPSRLPSIYTLFEIIRKRGMSPPLPTSGAASPRRDEGTLGKRARSQLMEQIYEPPAGQPKRKRCSLTPPFRTDLPHSHHIPQLNPNDAHHGFSTQHPGLPHYRGTSGTKCSSYPTQRGAYSSLALPGDDRTHSNIIHVRNQWQNAGYRSPHGHILFTQMQGAPQAQIPRTSMERSAETIGRVPQQTIREASSRQGRVYDLAKITRMGFSVHRGRVYNQQNHPMCAAPRENGTPCKRNVSRSPCRWHGNVRLLTMYNTRNGILDINGNLAQVRNESNGSPQNAQLVTPGARIHPAQASLLLSQASTPPRVVTRTLRWNNEEHFWFLIGLQRYGHKWSIISKVVGTRNTLQVQSHAQKFFERQNKIDKKKSTIHDLRIEGRELSEVAQRYSDEEIERRLSLVGVEDAGIGAKREAGPSSARN